MSDPRIENARQLMAAGKLDEAMGVLKAALKDDPGNADVKALLVEIQERLMLQLQIDEKMKRVHLLLKEGFKENAQTLLEEILKIDGQNREASELLKQLQGGGETVPGPQEPPAPPAAEPPAAGVDSEELPFGPPQPFDDSQAFPEGGPKLDESEPSPFDDLDESGDENVFELESAPAPDVEDTHTTPPPLEIPLEPLTEGENAAPGTSLSPQEKEKVDGYIAEGKALYDQGRYQEAIDTWSRIFIIDEESREAQELIDKAKAGLEQSQGEWQTSLTEGIAAYTAGDLAKAEGLFQKVLERFPENSEAQYYLSRIRGQGVPEATPGAPSEPPAAPPGETGSETPPEPSGFEFEDDAPAPGKFEFESGPPEPPKAEVPSAPPGPVPAQPPSPPPESEAQQPPGRFEQPEGGDEEFVLERGAPPEAPAASDSSAKPPEDSSWDDIAPPPPPPGFGPQSGESAGPPGAPPPPPPPGPGDGGAAMAPAKKPAVRKKVIGVGVGIAAVAVIAVIGAVIFWLTFSSNSGAGTAPSVPVSSVGRHKPRPKQKPKPKAPAPAAEQNPTGAQAEPAEPKPMTVDELLAAGKAAEGKKDYRKAATLYREALAKDALNTKAQDALASAQEAYEKQQEEARRNKAFLDKYQKSTQAFQDKDWADCLRQAWRLIYPDDTLASQLGKRQSIRDLIRDGYYNWAVQDLKAQNIQGAVKHLNDLLEFDGSDSQAKKLKAFAERYTKMPPDDIYADTVQALTYRTLQEEP